MTKQNFIDDLQKIYDYLDEQKAKTNELLKFLENSEFEKLTIIDEFATKEFWLYFILSRRQKWKILQYLNGIERGVGDTEAKSGFFQR